MLTAQAASFEAIKTICTNYNKDSTSRKTLDYLEKRLERLEDAWVEFHERHEEIVEKITDKTQVEYFTKNVYETIKAMYEATKKNMTERLVYLREFQQQCKVEFDLTGFLDETTGDNLKELMNTQECNFKALGRTMSKIDVEYLSEMWEIKDHLSTLKSKWQEIDKLHWKLESVLKGSYVKEEYYPKFESIEREYDNLKKTLNRKLNSNINYQRSAPQIEIPSFSGDYMQWLSFKDTFTDVIHNNPTLTNCQKMQHLKTKLRGEAEKLVQHLTINADNYLSCWDILTRRYDNRRLQFTSIMNAMNQLPVIQTPTWQSLKKMHDIINECMNALANMGVEVSNWDPMVVYYMTQKFNSATYDEFTNDLKDKREIPDLHDLLSFLENKFVNLETNRKSYKETLNSTSSLQKPFERKFQYQRNRNFNYNNKYNFKNYSDQRHHIENSNLNARNRDQTKTFHTMSYGKCPLCNGEHVLMQCDKFVAMHPMQRNETVAKLHVCKNCLYNHGNGICSSFKTCKECNLKHHTLLHFNEPTAKKSGYDFKPPKPSTSKQQTSNSHYISAENVEVLLTTVQVQIQSRDGTYVTLRALLDQGSQVNLITENAAQRLRLERSKMIATVSGIGSGAKDCKGLVRFTGRSIHSEYSFTTEALVLNQITNKLPTNTIPKADWPHIETLKLADPEYYRSSSIDLLLGADIYADILLDGVLKGELNSPIAQQTKMGWILCGRLKTYNCHVTVADLSELSRYWETEDITEGPEDISQDKHCELYYQNTTKRASDGKYIVKMPMIADFGKYLGKSRPAATSQFLNLENRLKSNQKLASMYRNFIEEYIELQHMKPARQITNTEVPECYLPHHGVLRESSSTTKLRVVFNASQKTTSQKSLNSLMEKGPNLQKDIQELILKWRTYKHAFTADIEKMYRCIWIAEEQQNLQKIVWRNSTSQLLQEYVLCTVTYGTKCAPWLAMRTLQQLAIDDGHKYPMAAKILKNEFYVDDLVSGHNSLETAKELQTSLIQLLNGGGMNLRKWSSNTPELLENLNADQISKTSYDFKHEDSMKTLGLGWNPNSDTFTFNWNLEETTKLTKRNLLSQISQLYDPLGWLSPVTITAKLIFQEVWAEKLNWDEELTPNIQENWLKLRTELPILKTIKMKRWIGSTRNDIDLVGFCDASNRAYSCTIYTRIKDDVTGQPIITLLVAKTRVAPLSQKLSLPRLELAGALLLSQLLLKVKNALREHNISTWAYTDSKVVLAWIQSTESKWQRYVENRVIKIRKVIPATQWNYVESKNNPADCATRGFYPNKLLHLKLWWEGPALLKEFSETKPKTEEAGKCLFTTNIEEKAEVTTLVEIDNNLLYELIYKHSSLTRAIRVLAWILRFVAITRRSAKTIEKYDTTMAIPNYLTMKELNEANKVFIKYTQRNYFKTEYNLLLKNENLTKKSALFKLFPFINEEGIICVGGRLNKSYLPAAMKNPIILPRDSRITQLLIEEAHLVTLHGGPRLTLAHIRQRYWFIGGNRTVKTLIRRCVRCHRYKTNQNYQLMADLPVHRVTPSRPFTHLGVDFTGHVDVKLNKGRGVRTTKGYIAIFVCMATKAVHIELVSDLSTETFLAAFQRLCARRGTPKHVYSDCGTNFIGASKMLRNEYELFTKELPPEFFDELNKLEVEWHFNAPKWPTAGGLWEAAVRSCKYHLRRVLGDQKLTYEEFSTLLAKIEACMNSRPLCPLTEDPEEFSNYLTPGHFLTGSATMTLPLSSYVDDRNIDLRRRWQLTEHMFHRFWKLWSNDYLTQLQARSKWQKPAPNLKIDDIVLVKEDNMPPGKWAMGRVIELHPGSDGHVRVATIKTQSSQIKRPITKLSPLPVEHSDSKHYTTSTELLKSPASETKNDDY